MRISDWSSDVCSSDLRVVAVAGLEHELVGKHRVLAGARVGFGGALAGDLDLRGAAELVDEQRLPGAAPGQLTGAGVVGVAVDFRGLLAPAIGVDARLVDGGDLSSEEHTSELQSLMRHSYA